MEDNVNRLPFLTPVKMAGIQGIVAAMSTREGGVSPEPLCLNMSYNVGDEAGNVARNRAIFLRAIGCENMHTATTMQVHGDTLLRVDAGGSYPSCDALLTCSPGVLLAISIADCVPILLCDPVRNVVAAVHAGWRGTEQHIVAKAVSAMTKWKGCQPESLVAFIGPSARVCCYEVGEEVAGRFGPEFVDRTKVPKPHLDVCLVNADALKRCGVLPENIEISPYCTICAGNRFHSFRRDGRVSGRMWAVIGIR